MLFLLFQHEARDVASRVDNKRHMYVVFHTFLDVAPLDHAET